MNPRYKKLFASKAEVFYDISKLCENIRKILKSLILSRTILYSLKYA